MLPWGNNRPTLARLWSKTSDWPMGRQIFSKILGQMAPYTGTIGATVLEISDGHAVVELRERRGVRNHRPPVDDRLGSQPRLKPAHCRLAVVAQDSRRR